MAAAYCDTRDDRLDFLRYDLIACQIIEEKERFCPLHHDIVHAHGHRVDADRIVLIHGKGDFQLRAYAIRSRDEHRLRVFVLIQSEQSAKAAQVGHHFRTERPFDVFFHPLNRFIPGRDINAGFLVCFRHERDPLLWIRGSSKSHLSITK
ncbi:hypothetical protein D3C74_295330 [compost metagenome]